MYKSIVAKNLTKLPTEKLGFSADSGAVIIIPLSLYSKMLIRKTNCFYCKFKFKHLWAFKNDKFLIRVRVIGHFTNKENIQLDAFFKLFTNIIIVSIANSSTSWALKITNFHSKYELSVVLTK